MLGLEREHLVRYIDKQVSDILSEDQTNRDLLMILGEVAGDLNKLMNGATEEEMNLYCLQYEGFHVFMNFFADMTQTISNEMLSCSTYH